MTVRAYDNQHPEIDESVWIDPSAVVIGKVTLGKEVSVWPQVVIRGDVNTITVGSQTNIQDGAILHCTHDGPYSPGGKALTIGERVTIGHQACLHGCTIGQEVLIGIGATVLDGGDGLTGSPLYLLRFFNDLRRQLLFIIRQAIT
jgi:carbonic anhydrase/acetyltransferase-like protein (isoleucine patch superfamily)